MLAILLGSEHPSDILRLVGGGTICLGGDTVREPRHQSRRWRREFAHRRVGVSSSEVLLFSASRLRVDGVKVKEESRKNYKTGSHSFILH